MSGDSSDTNANAGALKFVYAWQLIMFVGLLAYGALVLFKFRGPLAQSRMALWSLLLLLLGWMNFSFLFMWLLANGSIYTEGRELETVGGFYNQFSVLLFMTQFWYLLWSLCFSIALAIRIFKKSSGNPTQQEGLINNTEPTKESPRPGDSMNYLPYTEPSVTITGVSYNTLPPAENKTTWW
jgi:hypothetical protein